MKKNPKDVGKLEHIYRRILHILELIIAAVSVVVLVVALGVEIYRMATVSGYFADIHNFLIPRQEMTEDLVELE